MKRLSILYALFLMGLALLSCRGFGSRIDRYGLVRRHNPELMEADPNSPFTVGNGEFALTADITGLQTFPDYYYENGIPLETMSDWAWHAFPNPGNYTLNDASESIVVGSRTIAYPTRSDTPAGDWLRSNPHRIPLGVFGFDLKKQDGSEAEINDIQNIEQKLNMWTGLLESDFSLEGASVNVQTVCHPEQDVIAVRIQSVLIKSGQLGLRLRFPYSHDHRIKNNPPMDWKNDRHETRIVKEDAGRIVLKRTLDDRIYYVVISSKTSMDFMKKGAHEFIIVPKADVHSMTICVQFVPEITDASVVEFAQVREASKTHWKRFWERGGVIDFSDSQDNLAQELERRVVLSQYLTRVQCAGSLPPQESGLTLSSWHGKFHTEMVWWNTAHFLLWGHEALLEKSFQWFPEHLEQAVRTAQKQGFAGARWSKMVGPDGRESPGNNPFILWNQPHPIFLADMLYRANPSQALLTKYQDVVFETAIYMADFVRWNGQTQKYDIGPPVWPVQEVYEPRTTKNPVFELAYWKFGFEIAQRWRKYLGMEPVEKWTHIIENMAPLPTVDSLYVAAETSPGTFLTEYLCTDHPSMLMPYGFLPGNQVDQATMRHTLQTVLRCWNWDTKVWGWDYPMIAMTAARLNEPKMAVGILLMDAPHNRYLNNGHCPQNRDLPVYLPANGALLSAVAMMAAGWEGAPDMHAPGFPKEDGWKVRYENLRAMP
ncbi:hypothetical protein JW948_05480 [bacterium]|nr:hypothetical protein [bacterium]